MVSMASHRNSYLEDFTRYEVLSSISIYLERTVLGYWLYIAARFEKEKKWLWCLLGFFGGIYGVLIFYPYLILKELRKKNEPNSRNVKVLSDTSRF